MMTDMNDIKRIKPSERDSFGINKKIGYPGKKIPGTQSKYWDAYEKELRKLEDKQMEKEKKELYDKQSKFGKSVSNFGSSASKTLKSIKFKSSKLGRF